MRGKGQACYQARQQLLASKQTLTLGASAAGHRDMSNKLPASAPMLPRQLLPLLAVSPGSPSLPHSGLCIGQCAARQAREQYLHKIENAMQQQLKIG